MDGLRTKVSQYYGHVLDDVELLSTLIKESATVAVGKWATVYGDRIDIVQLPHRQNPLTVPIVATPCRPPYVDFAVDWLSRVSLSGIYTAA